MILNWDASLTVKVNAMKKIGIHARLFPNYRNGYITSFYMRQYKAKVEFFFLNGCFALKIFVYDLIFMKIYMY